MAFNTTSTLALKPTSAAASWEARQDQAAQAKEAGKLREACKMFEAQFVKMMMSEMRKTVSKGGIIDGGFGEEMFTDSLDEARADAIVQGRGIGLSEMLQFQLSRDSYQKPVQFRMPARAADAYAAAAANAGPTASRQPENNAAMDTPPNTSGNWQQGNIVPATPLMSKIADIKAGAVAMREDAQAVTAGSDYVWPLQDARVSSNFGMRFHPILKVNRYHSGMDLSAPTGTPIQAAAEGRVIFAGNRGQLGKAVIVEHSDGSRTVYGHCSRLLVREGQTVGQGDAIAKVGSTGLVTGPHLHFEIRNPEGKATDPLLSLAPRERGPEVARNARNEELAFLR